MKTAAQQSPAVVRQAAIAGGCNIYHDTTDLIGKVLGNPIVELVLAYALVHKLNERQMIGGGAGPIIETAAIGLITAQQIAPLMPDIIRATGSLTGSLGQVAGIAGAGKLLGLAAGG